MRKILSSRSFRILVCLVLICCFLANSSPIKAEAMALPEAGAAATASKIISLTAPLGTQIFGWVLLGLGLTISTINMINLVNDFQAYSDTMEVSIYYYPDGSWSYGVDMDFVERVRAFLFDTGVLELSIPFPDSDSVSNYDALVSNINAFKSYPYALVVYHDSVQWTVCGSYSPCSFFKTTDGNYYLFRTDDSSRSIVFVKTFNSGETSQLDWNVSTVTSFCRFGTANSDDTDFDIISDYELGTVAPLEVPVPEGYPEWYTNARPATNPDTDEEKIILPIPLNPDSESEGLPEGATQPDAWAGSNADALPDMDTDADAGTDTDPDTGTSSDPWTPPSDMGKFTLDLKNYFPFCIPFDLYNFFTCLNAEPVALVIEWIIPMPGGDSYPLEIDLSVFDPVAQLLRRLELLLFCVGLAFKTRDLIKG